LWQQKLSSIPPEAVPYMTSEYIMKTDRLRTFLGPEYPYVMHYSVVEAFEDSFQAPAAAALGASGD